MTKPGMSNEQFARDNYDCYRDSLPPRPSYVWPNQQETDRRLYQMCMEARGYSRDSDPALAQESYMGQLAVVVSVAIVGVSCSTSREIYTADGRPGYSINCSGNKPTGASI